MPRNDQDIANSVKEVLEKKGIEIGMEKGREEGREEGVREANLNNARNLKKLGIAIDVISQATGLSKEEIEKTEEIVYKLIEEYNLDEELLWDRVRKRLEISNDSASNAVKTMFEIQLKEMEINLNILLSKEKEFLVIQRDLERELADCIQADEEMIVFEKLSEHGKKLDDIDKKIIKLEEKIQEIKYNIQSEWPYEIYGLIKKEDLYDKVKDFNKN